VSPHDHLCVELNQIRALLRGYIEEFDPLPAVAKEAEEALARVVILVNKFTDEPLDHPSCR
jgi:hypothetical protein